MASRFLRSKCAGGFRLTSIYPLPTVIHDCIGWYRDYYGKNMLCRLLKLAEMFTQHLDTTYLFITTEVQRNRELLYIHSNTKVILELDAIYFKYNEVA